MSSPTSATFVIHIEDEEQEENQSTFNVIDWLCMKRQMGLMMTNRSDYWKTIIGVSIHMFLISASICSGVLYGYLLFPKMFEPSGDSEDTKESLSLYKLLYLITSTTLGFIVMIIQESFNYLIQSKLDKRLENIEDDISILKDDVRVLKEDVRVLKDDVRVLKKDVRVLKDDVRVLKDDVRGLKKDLKNLTIKVDTNFQILFDHLGINIPSVPIDLPLEKPKKNGIKLEPLIDTHEEYHAFETTIAFGQNAKHDIQLEHAHQEIRNRSGFIQSDL